MPNNEKTLVLMRGLPWTGKSYTAAEMLKQFREDHGDDVGVILSTDEYFYVVNKPEQPEEYSFDPQQLGRAHQWNLERAKREIDTGNPLVIIDNTNTLPWEGHYYAVHASGADYNICIREPTSERWLEIRELLKNRSGKEAKRELRAWAQLLAEGSRETHSVPAHAIEKMMWRWHNDMEVDDVLTSKPPK